MKTRIIALVTCLFVVGLGLATGPGALACENENPDKGICAGPRTPRPTVTATPTKRPTPVVVATQGPVFARADRPQLAIAADDTWRNIAAGTSVWHKMDELPRPHNLEVWLDANGNKSIGFAMYGPDQIQALPDTKPVGRGTFNRSLADHDLRWSGNSAIDGAWYAVVTNYSDGPISYKIGYNKLALGQRNCHSYWEWIGSNRVYWTA